MVLFPGERGPKLTSSVHLSFELFAVSRFYTTMILLLAGSRSLGLFCLLRPTEGFLFCNSFLAGRLLLCDSVLTVHTRALARAPAPLTAVLRQSPPALGLALVRTSIIMAVPNLVYVLFYSGSVDLLSFLAAQLRRHGGRVRRRSWWLALQVTSDPELRGCLVAGSDATE